MMAAVPKHQGVVYGKGDPKDAPTIGPSQECRVCNWTGSPTIPQQCQECGSRGALATHNEEYELVDDDCNDEPVTVQHVNRDIWEHIMHVESMLNARAEELRQSMEEMNTQDEEEFLECGEGPEENKENEPNRTVITQEELEEFLGYCDIDDYMECNMAAEDEPEFLEMALTVALDSGCGEHVADKEEAPGYSVHPSAGSIRGQKFIAAGVHKMADRGEFTLQLRTSDGKGRSLKSTFQVANVTRPLWSVSKICDEGFSVLFNTHKAVIKRDTDHKDVCSFV